MRILVTGGAGFIGSDFVRMALTSRLPGVDADRAGRPRRPDLRGQPREPRPGRGRPAAALRRGRHPATPDARRRARRRAPTPSCTSPPSRTSTARSWAPRDVRPDQRGRHPDAARRRAAPRRRHGSCTSPPTRCTARSTTGSWPETHAAGAELAVRRVQGRQRPDGPRLPPHPRAATCVITRCSNNYGPYQFPEKVIPLFVTNLIDGGTVPLYGDGRNVRDWLHVDDHCRGIALVARRRSRPARSTTSAAAPS